LPALYRQPLVAGYWVPDSAYYPAAQLPGGDAPWQVVDDPRARPVVRSGPVRSSLLASVDADGRLRQFDAEEPSDLDTQCHGSAEQVTRDDWRDIGGVTITHRFVISRVGPGRMLPFWDGQVTAIRLLPGSTTPR
jgi:hypothetical protein